MRRMLLPEAKIKSKLKDDVFVITMEELFTHSHMPSPTYPSPTIIIQPIVQYAGDKDDGDGGVYISDSNLINTDITNATLTISRNTVPESYDNLIINGLGINIVIDLLVTNIEDVNINSINVFDIYIIKP